MRPITAKLKVGLLVLAVMVAVEPTRHGLASQPRVTPQASRPHWQAQSSGVLSRLSSVCFIDAQRGWAAGSNGTLLATTDGGAHWRRVRLAESYANEPLQDLWFFDAARGCVLGEYARADRRALRDWAERIFALTSDDGGARWSAATLAHPLPKRARRDKEADQQDNVLDEPDAVLVRMSFGDARTGWACGESGAIQTTRDGGRTWTRQAAPTRKLLYDVAAVDADCAWIVGAGGTVLRTTDGGRNWNQQPSGTTAALRAAHFIDARRGWAVGADGVILVTTSGGNRWQPQPSDTQSQLNDVFFLNAQEGWAAGANGLLLHTLDGGATWEDESLNTHAQLNRLFFRAPDCGWVVGASGALFHYSR